MSKNLTIALAGNPNIGKTTLFNALTGANYTVGNWAGVTVEKKEGFLKHRDCSIVLVDLPGTYSLSAFSLDESIARNYIIKEDPHVILNLVDASNLERNLYLTLQLIELGKPVVLALNMMDRVKQQDIEIDIPLLSYLLNVPIIPIVASKKTGLLDLLDVVASCAAHAPNAYKKIVYPTAVENEISKLMHAFDLNNLDLPARWFSLKILEGDTDIIHLLPPKLQADLKPVMAQDISVDIRQSVTDSKYAHLGDIIQQVVTQAKDPRVSISHSIDRIVTHKWIGLPLFAAIMFAIFYFTFNLVGDPLAGLLEILFAYVMETTNILLQSIGVANWLCALIVEGILQGVFGVLTFLPNIACLFTALTILEDTGYMSRVAFIMDELMKKVGLNGKAIIPMLLGFGCNVPAILGTRTIENEKDRLTSILINPFFSCSARLPVFALFTSVFFPTKAAFVIFSLYFLGILVGILVAFIFKHTLFKSDDMPFIMELPAYHLPSPSSVFNQVWEKIKGFLVKAGTIIFVASILLWVILNFNFNGPSDMTNSLGASIGRVIAPLFSPLGFGNWQASLSLMTGVVGKEFVVANMAIIYGGTAPLDSSLGAAFTPLGAYAFLVFTLLYIPCIGTLGAIRRETNSLKWVAFSVFYQTAIAWCVTLLITVLGRLLGF